MPCNCDGYEPSDSRKLRDFRAALCAVLTVLTDRGELASVLADCDWTEAGISERWLSDWWIQHRAHDQQRRLVEAQRVAREQEYANLRTRALAKLTQAEAVALGLL